MECGGVQPSPQLGSQWKADGPEYIDLSMNSVAE